MTKRFSQIVNMANSINYTVENMQYNTDKDDLSLSNLRIVYVMNHVRVCGGVKIVLEHANELVKRGHHVTLVCREPKPEWKEIKAEYIQAKQQKMLVESIPPADIIVCTVADQLPECFLFGKAPTVLFEQGDIYIYEFEQQTEFLKNFYKKIWNIPVPIFGVSNVLLNTIELNFSRIGTLLPNALDKGVFFPRNPDTKSERIKILFVGQEDNAFKGVSVIRNALQIVRDKGYDFEEVWVTQTPPQSPFKGTLIVNPSQEILGATYRDCDIYISGSYYESFPLPPLEAMASGCAVISTDNEGIKEYAVDRENCLMGKIGNPHSLAHNLIELLSNESLRNQLVIRGYETANKYSWEKIILKWEQYLIQATRNPQAVTFSKTSIRLERIRKGLSYSKVINLKISILESMEEEWCLFLVEDEQIEASALEYLHKVLSKSDNQTKFLLPVTYENEIPGHPVLRLENRLLKRNYSVGAGALPLPFEISGATESYFLPEWKYKIKKYYLKSEFERIISYIQTIFKNLTTTEKLVACRWMVLSLIEVENYKDAFKIAESGLGLDPTYSDLLYLFGRLLLMEHNESEAKRLFGLAKFCGTAIHHEDAFNYIEEITEAYIESIILDN
jgi:L-malate glycosyltransferase